MDIPTYSGWLGVLAGDIIRSAAELNVPMAAVTLLHREAYFYQKLDEDGVQTEEPVQRVVEDFLESLGQTVTVDLEDRHVKVKAWKYEVKYPGKNTIFPLYYIQPEEFRCIMSHCVALNGSFFNTQRMMQQYVFKAYFS